MRTTVRVGRLIVLVALLGSITVACASDGGASGSASGSAPSKLVDPAAFAARMAEPGVVTINVHTPDEGSIAVSDLMIPFDEIATSSELPEDTSTPLAIYCRSGNMSAEAAVDLRALGYDDITELDGGFDAWVADGRVLLSS